MEGVQKAEPKDVEKPNEYIGLSGTVVSYTRRRGLCGIT